MAVPTKFLFDTEFERDGSGAWRTQDEPDPATTPVHTALELEAAREEAHAAGHAEGVAQAKQEIDAAAVNSLEIIGSQFDGLMGSLSKAAEDARIEAAGLALLIARKLAHALIEREPIAEIEAMIASCLSDLTDLGGEHRVVVRAPLPLVEALNEHMTALTAGMGFNGRLAVIGDETLQDTDCRVEWADGGAERDMAALEALIETSVHRYAEASRATVGPGPAPADPAEAEDPAATPTDGVIEKGGGSKSVRLGPAEVAEEPAADPDVRMEAGAKSVRLGPAENTETESTEEPTE